MSKGPTGPRAEQRMSRRERTEARDEAAVISSALIVLPRGVDVILKAPEVSARGCCDLTWALERSLWQEGQPLFPCSPSHQAPSLEDL